MFSADWDPGTIRHLEALGEGRVRAGTLTQKDLEMFDRLQALLDDPNFVYLSQLMIAAWGRRAPAFFERGGA